MIRQLRSVPSVASLCLLVLLSGCADASRSALPLAGAPAAHGSAVRGRGVLTVRVRIPHRHRRKVGAHYISAATAGMTLAVTGPSNLTEAIALTSADPRCSGTPLVCTIAVSLAPGSYTADVTTYDQAPVNGQIPGTANQLSIARSVPLAIVLQQANEFDVTLDGVPSSIAVGGFPSAFVGTAFSAPKIFSVTVKDAGGYTIVGTYSTPVVLADGDSSGATAIVTAGSDNPQPGQLLGSADTATISYTGKAIAPVTVGASAGVATGSGIFTPQLPIYVSDTYNNAVKEFSASCGQDGCATAIGSGFSHPSGLAVDGSGNVFVADFLNSEVKEISAVDGSVRTLGSGFNNPAGVAVDGSGNVFVADSGNNRVKEIEAVGGAVPASPTIETLGFGLNTPYGVALDSSGDVFVTDAGNNAVKEMEAVGGVVPASPTILTLGSGFYSPAGIAVDVAGNVYVADLGHAAVKEIPALGGSVVTLDGAFSEPFDVAIDDAGNLYVTDDTAGTVTELEAVGGSMPPSPVAVTVGSDFFDPTGVAVPR